MTGARPTAAQQAIDFLLHLHARDVDWSILSALVDYASIVRLAEHDGFDIDEAGLQEAFYLMMRARLMAAARAARPLPARPPRDSTE